MEDSPKSLWNYQSKPSGSQGGKRRDKLEISKSLYMQKKAGKGVNKEEWRLRKALDNKTR